MKNGQKVIVTQTRSTACRTKDMDKRLQALGLGRIGKSSVVTLNDSVMGMIKRLNHLVSVEEYKGK